MTGSTWKIRPPAKSPRSRSKTMTLGAMMRKVEAALALLGALVDGLDSLEGQIHPQRGHDLAVFVVFAVPSKLDHKQSAVSNSASPICPHKQDVAGEHRKHNAFPMPGKAFFGQYTINFVGE